MRFFFFFYKICLISLQVKILTVTYYSGHKLYVQRDVDQKKARK